MASVPSHSRAAVLRHFGEPTEIEEFRCRDEIEAGAILVKTESLLDLRHGRSPVAGIAGAQGRPAGDPRPRDGRAHRTAGGRRRARQRRAAAARGRPHRVDAHRLQSLLLLHRRPPADAVREPARIHVREHGAPALPARRLFRIRLCAAGVRPFPGAGQRAERTRQLVQLRLPLGDERLRQSRRHSAE